MSNLLDDKNRRVLVIDDNHAIHDDFRKILCPPIATAVAWDATKKALFGPSTDEIRQTQFDVDSAYQGQEGVLLVKQALEAGRPYAMAFVDVRMPPGWDGVETTRHLWELDPDLQIVLCTAYSDYSWRELFERIGNSDGLVILKKPFDAVEAFQLAHAFTEKWGLHQRSRRKMEELECMVAERTSELQETNHTLQRQQTELRVLFDFVPAMLCFKDTENGILRVNKQFADYLGKPVEQIEGKSFREICPRDADRFHVEDVKVIHSRVPKLGVIEEVQNSQGDELWLQKDRVPVCNEDGEVMGVIVMAQDITTRRQAEERLREQATLLDKAQDAIFVRDLDHRILYWNRSAERLYGWTSEEVKGCLIHELLQVDADKFSEVHRAVLETGEWNGELQKTARKGDVLTVDSRWTLMRDALDRPHSILTIDTDVTERKQIEKQSLRSQRMESIGTLAGGIAHDLNNVLAPILMGVGYLKMKYPDAADILDRFESSANRGAGMVRQLLTFAKGAEGERVSIQTSHLVMEMKELMEGTFPKNIRVEVSCEPDLPTVLGDASQLHQILLNLCVNARDAMPSGGTLTVEARPVEVDATFAAAVPDAKPGRYVVLRVRDTGTGISPAVLERIFDPFFTTKGPDKGTGLGLSTVMGIVKGLGGFLQVFSAQKRGSTFAVHLPAEMEGGRSQLIEVAEPSLPGQGEAILLVDDEAGVLEVGRMVLTALNYRVVTAVDGTEGLIKAIEHQAELHAVITDMHMPNMDGLAFLRALRRVLPDIPVIIGSGRLDEAAMKGLQALGVVHRLDKPYTQKMLAAMLARLLAGAKAAGGSR